MTQTATERRREIGNTIFDAMKKVDVDWSVKSSIVTETFSAMEEAMALYSEGKISKAEVKVAYKAWVDAHRGGTS